MSCRARIQTGLANFKSYNSSQLLLFRDTGRNERTNNLEWELRTSLHMDLLHYVTYHMTRSRSLSLTVLQPQLFWHFLDYAMLFLASGLCTCYSQWLKTVSSPFFYTLSLQSQLKYHFFDEFLFSTASKVAKPLLSYHTLPSISLLYVFYYTYRKL